MSDRIRVRYAPSPTGHLHIGNARTALFNYLFARHHDGDFIIRIEDTDLKRNIADGESSQLSNLHWLGMDWDEGPDCPGEYGPYRQSERRAIYDPLIQQLLDEGKAYHCYMTEEELEQEREEQRARGEMPHYGGKHAHLSPEEEEAFIKEGRQPVVRFRVPKEKIYSFDDMVKGPISFEGKSVAGDFVIQKRDGMPTYNFAVVVDDHFMKITHVLRGDDHVANTPKQLMIYEAFGWEPPRFGHMTLIINSETGKKLSKRDETILQFIEQYKELGYLPEALFNFIALLGWSPVGEEELFSRLGLIDIFDEHRLGKSPAAFDKKKLEWIANQYFKKADLTIVAPLAIEQLIKAGVVTKEEAIEKADWLTRIVSLYQEQMAYAAQIVDLSQLFFEESISFGPQEKEILSGEQVATVLTAFREAVEAMPEWKADNVMAAIKSVQKATKIKGKNLYMPIRVATSGSAHGPAIGDMIELLGRERVLHHLDLAEASWA